jgi:hypothetical protein
LLIVKVRLKTEEKNMHNPYAKRADYTVWSRAVSGKTRLQMQVPTKPRFTITPLHKIATAGSCFAQYLSLALPDLGMSFMDYEKDRRAPGEPIFSARYGNIYTARQLLQLFEFAYGLRENEGGSWVDQQGMHRDPLRPTLESLRGDSRDFIVRERELHLATVRRVFEEAEIFIFTLGLTEGWVGKSSGVVIPVHPGVLRIRTTDEEYRDCNFSVDETVSDLSRFLESIKKVNPYLRMILTVSPVPLAATFKDRHVLVSTTYSKSVLRVAAEQIVMNFSNVDYFPSYEIVTGPSIDGSAFGDDLRKVQPELVSHIMTQFADNYRQLVVSEPIHVDNCSDKLRKREQAKFEALSEAICDDDLLE